MMKNLTLKLCFVALLLTSLTLNVFAQVPALTSNPGTQSSPKPTIFLDFDGHTVQSAAWQGGTRFICDPAAMSGTQITDVFNRVSEDFRPFDVTITTDSTKFLMAPISKRIRIVVTPTSAWYQGVGGVSYIGSFTWGDDTPGFVFSDRLANAPKYVSECCTHETGHTLGLSHQSKYDSACNLTQTYRTGTGSGQTAWAPVMGNSYYSNMTGWDNGPTPNGCAVSQDNLSILTTKNGFSYRADDFTSTLDNTTTVINPANFNIKGIISTNTDVDAFKFTITQPGYLHINVTPYSVGPLNEGADLDVKVTLYSNTARTLIATYDPIDAMNISIDTTLNAGDYFIQVAGSGNANTTGYGSLGSYSLTSSAGPLPIHNVSLKGNNDKGVHKLSWEIIADEPITSQLVEVSTNGTNFQTLVTDVNGIRSYEYRPSEKNTLFYRVKATNVLNQSLYSNIVAVKANGGNTDKLFTVSTLVQDHITVQAADNFTYTLFDVNGRAMAAGKALKGTSNIFVQGLSKGMYVLQMVTDNYKQTERIIKQ